MSRQEIDDNAVNMCWVPMLDVILPFSLAKSTLSISLVIVEQKLIHAISKVLVRVDISYFYSPSTAIFICVVADTKYFYLFYI